MEQKKWKVSYLDKSDNLTNVWVYADSAEDAKDVVMLEYWDVDEIIRVVPL